jgi:hypothetical protein
MPQVQRSRRGSGSWAVVSVPGSVWPVLRAGVIGFRAHVSRWSARCSFPVRKWNGKPRGGGYPDEVEARDAEERASTSGLLVTRFLWISAQVVDNWVESHE